MEKGPGAELGPKPSIDVLITGRSGTSKSILINGIFGREVIQERHGVVSTARSSSLEFYNSTIDGIQVNVWVSSQLQDSSATDEQQYLEDLKAQCSNVDLVLYCVKMTETRFTPGNPDDVAITKISQALGNRVWEKTIFVLTYANLAAETTFGSQEFNSTATETFKASILQWKDVLETTVSRATAMPKYSLNLKVVPAGHYRVTHLPDRKFWLSSFWYECSGTLGDSPAGKTFHAVNSSRFKSPANISRSDFKGDIMNQPLVMGDIIIQPLGRIGESVSMNMKDVPKVVKYAGCVGCIGFIIGYLTGDFYVALKLAVVGIIICGVLSYL